MVALYEPDAALACGAGRIAVGTDAIRKFYADLLATGRTFDLGEQRPAMLGENLALTSTRLPNGIVTAEVARKQIEGTWLWVIDQPSISVWLRISSRPLARGRSLSSGHYSRFLRGRARFNVMVLMRL
jgi:hypothetical protein